MPPPSNISEATATLIPSLPYINTQTGIHDAGTTYTVWYKYVATASDGLMSYSFRGAGAYAPRVNIYIDDSSKYLGVTLANLMDQVPLISGRTYYFEIFVTSGNPNPATLTIDIQKSGVTTSFAAGQLFIRAASILSYWKPFGYTGLGAGILNPSTGEIVGFIPQFIVGESGDSLSSGIALYGDDYGILDPTYNSLYLYNTSFAIIATIPFNISTNTPLIRTSREHNKFIIGSPGYSGGGGLDAHFIEVSNTGVPTAITYFTGKIGLTAIANSANDQYLYAAALGTGSSINSSIERYNKSTTVIDTGWIPIVANHVVTDILVMSNGNLVICYYRNTTYSVIVRQYTSAGILVNNYSGTSDTYIAPRLGYANDDSLSFWLFLHKSTGFSNIIRLQLSDMSELVNWQSPDAYYMSVDRGTSPAYRFVTSDSCPITTLGGSGPSIEARVSQVAIETLVQPPSISGIYYINPNKATKHDSYYNNIELKIPNPTIKTALIGE